MWNPCDKMTTTLELCPRKLSLKLQGHQTKERVEVTMVLKASHVCVLEHQDEMWPDSWGL